ETVHALKTLQIAYNQNNQRLLFSLFRKLEPTPSYPLHNELGVPIFTDDGKCRLLTAHYKNLLKLHTNIPPNQNQYIIDKVDEYAIASLRNHNSELDNLFTEEEISKAISDFPTNKATFLDGISNELL